jgi:hypothetical protein
MTKSELKSLIKEVIREAHIQKKFGKLTVDELINNLSNGSSDDSELMHKTNIQATKAVLNAYRIYDKRMWQDTIVGRGYQDATLKFPETPEKG